MRFNSLKAKLEVDCFTSIPSTKSQKSLGNQLDDTLKPFKPVSHVAKFILMRLSCKALSHIIRLSCKPLSKLCLCAIRPRTLKGILGKRWVSLINMKQDLLRTSS